jgi:hypothetical protein
MINVQLAPAGELEDKQWWHVDAAFVVVIVVMGCFVANWVLDQKRHATGVLQAEADKKVQELAVILPSIAQIGTLQSQKSQLFARIEGINDIFRAKIFKIRALVALDQMQTLWLDGVWYEKLTYSSTGDMVVNGSSYDSLLIGEFMLGLSETMNPQNQNDDARTRLGFDKLSLNIVKDSVTNDEIFDDVQRHLKFEIQGSHVEKQTERVKSLSAVPRSQASGVIGL